jgi:diguanylate cyclase (GGDEF)-like protein
MQAETRRSGGIPTFLDSPAQDELDFSRSLDEAGPFDHRYVGALVVLRWIIVLTYAALILLGVLPMQPLAAAGSVGWIAATNLLAVWVWIQRRPVGWYDAWYLYLDFLSVTFAVLATANLSYPVWLAYVLLMIQASAEHTARFSARFNGCCAAAYVACAAILDAAGWYEPAWGTVIVAAAILGFAGANLVITFDGNRRLRAYIRKMAVTDPLTGLANRRSLSRALTQNHRTETPIAVIVLDVDDFKRYNDAFGHLAGDQLLLRLADALRTDFPDAIVTSRYGGDEFVVLLPCASVDEAAARVKKLVASRPHDRIPVSVGLAVWPFHESTLDGALAAADDCLRQAKLSRKGTLVTAGSNSFEHLPQSSTL